MSQTRPQRALKRSSRPRCCSRAVGLSLVALSLAAADCGSSSPSASVASLGSTTTTTIAGVASSNSGLQQAVHQAEVYAQCMRSHGDVNVPDPNSLGLFGNTSRTTTMESAPGYKAASAACKKLLPNRGRPSQAQLQVMEQNMLKWAKCMQTHGLSNFPEPVISSHLIGFQLNGIDPTSPHFQKVQEICSKLLPGSVGPLLPGSVGP